MISLHDLIEKDLQHLWHPCAQMKEYETFKPLAIIRAEGCYFELEDGRQIIDGISSWWCKSLGHGHPRLQKAIKAQIEKFEHISLTHTTNQTIVALSEALAQLLPPLNKVFYASEGSSAVEIALKMSVHAHLLRGEPWRNRFIALENGYHGETMGAMSVSDLKLYRAPYESLLFPVTFLSPIPYVNSINDPLWDHCEQEWKIIESQLLKEIQHLSAIIIEPIVQGAAGMKIYSQDFLKRLRAFATTHGIHLIADEIMTGFGRTGKMLACEHAGIVPDFLCLSKGMISGWLPMSAVLTHDAIYDLFYGDYHLGKSFLHSHTFSGNALAASVALEVLHIFKEENIIEQTNELGAWLLEAMCEVFDVTGKLANVRQIGAIAAAEITSEHPTKRLSLAVAERAAQFGAMLRPIGNTLYWLPPLIMDRKTVSKLKEITIETLNF